MTKQKKKGRKKATLREILGAFVALAVLIVFFISTLFVMFGFFSPEGIVFVLIIAFVLAVLMRKRMPRWEDYKR